MSGLKIYGVTVKADFSFFAFNAIIFLLRDSRVIFGFYTVCAVHEFGHLLAAELTGTRIRSVELSGLGIRINTEKSGISPLSSSLFVLLSGPAANLILFFVLEALHCGGELPLLSLAAAVYNLLPYRCLDGGGIIALFTSGTVRERAAETILLCIKLAVTASLALLTLIHGAIAVPPLIASVILLLSDMRPR